MTETMALRGPDAGGLFVQGMQAFGHRRLSILDLAPASQQPMTDNELGLGIVEFARRRLVGVRIGYHVGRLGKLT